MLRISMTFLWLGLLGIAAGLQNWAGLSFESGRLIFFISLGIALITFWGALLSNRTADGYRRKRDIPVSSSF